MLKNIAMVACEVVKCLAIGAGIAGVLLTVLIVMGYSK